MQETLRKKSIRQLLLTLVVVLWSNAVTAQQTAEKPAPAPNPRVSGSVGFGFGLDYGGLGFRVEYLPVKWLGIFGASGYNFHRLTYNAGLSLRLLPGKSATPVLLGMYGYNSMMVIKSPFAGVSERRTYFGATVGAGGEFIVGKARMNRLSLKVLLPIRTKEFERDATTYRARGYPVAVSAGVHVGF